MKISLIWLIVTVVSLTNCAVDWSADENPQKWMDYSKNRIDTLLKKKINTNLAKNIVFFLGDGMGVTTVTAGRIRKGQLMGMNGEELVTSMEDADYVGLSKTYNIDAQTADSAGTATAYLTGVKARIGTIGVNGRAYDCKSSIGNHVDSILQWAKRAGKSVGIVTTTRVTHATPAGLYAHVTNRDWEAFGDSGFDQSIQSQGCKDIAAQLIEDHSDYIDVILAGGRRKFLNTTNQDYASNSTGDRKDGRNLIDEWYKKMASSGKSHTFVWNYTDFLALKPKQYERVFGLLAFDHLEFEHDRVEKDPIEEPSIIEMTQKAIELLATNPNGFFLLVEGGKIDHGHHESDASQALDEYAVFDNAIAKAKQITSSRDTLIVTTADHSHVFTIGGYSVRGNPILGIVISKYGNKSSSYIDENGIVVNGVSFTSLNYGNGPGGLKKIRKTDLNNIITEKKNYKQESAVFKSSETHGGEDVPVFAQGPMSYLFEGVYEQSHIAHAMAYASCLGPYDTKECRSDRGIYAENSSNRIQTVQNYLLYALGTLFTFTLFI